MKTSLTRGGDVAATTLGGVATATVLLVLGLLVLRRGTRTRAGQSWSTELPRTV
jgi:hypothetical protein